MTDAASVYALASELLAAAGSIVAGTSGGPLTNAYVSHGPPAFDCENTLTVHVGVIQYDPSLRRGPQDGGGQIDPRAFVVPIIPLTITALRCVNAQMQGGLAIRLPSGAEVASDAQKVYEDGWALFNGIAKLTRDGTLFGGQCGRIMAVDGVLPIAPDGGTLGWMLTLHVQLDGFDPPWL